MVRPLSVNYMSTPIPIFSASFYLLFCSAFLNVIYLSFFIGFSMFKGLGYAGFTITARNVLGQLAYKTVGRGKTAALEKMLIESYPGKMSLALHEEVMNGINGNTVSIA